MEMLRREGRSWGGDVEEGKWEGGGGIRCSLLGEGGIGGRRNQVSYTILHSCCICAPLPLATCKTC